MALFPAEKELKVTMFIQIILKLYMNFYCYIYSLFSTFLGLLKIYNIWPSTKLQCMEYCIVKEDINCSEEK